MPGKSGSWCVNEEGKWTAGRVASFFFETLTDPL